MRDNNKDLWDMRDLPIPSRENETVKQSVKPRSTSSSLAEWGEKSNFWGEWDNEFSPSRDMTAEMQSPVTQKSQSVGSNEQLGDDNDLHFEPWASQLAFHERRLEKEGTVDYGVPFRRQELLAATCSLYPTFNLGILNAPSH